MKLTLREWQSIFKDTTSLIVQASSIDCDDGWRPWPIGMCYQYINNYQKGPIIQIGNHDNMILNACRTHTDRSRRGSQLINRQIIMNNLANNNIPNIEIDSSRYFDILPSYKFIISPEGNGIDCHRHYEALIAGCIPIIEYNPLIEEKYKGCPILWTTDYSEITYEYLETKYKEMLDKEFDFSCLFLNHYSEDIQKNIKDSGNFWLQRLLNKTWY